MKKKYDWDVYYEHHKERPVKESLYRTLDLFKKDKIYSGHAFDLGCGNGHETRELLRKGWSVTATDKNKKVKIMLDDLKTKHKNNLDIQAVSFEKITWKKTTFIYANYSLPFCPANHFDKVWINIVDSLRRNGRFSGQFFGDRDEWDLVRHTKDQALERLEGMEIELFEEIEKDDKTTTGEMKHWHVFDIIAKKL
ncbi:MAG TPA: class I SAM-dependent methyltransferase [Ignavibacteria bacterium]|nr:class I SAM-dependent methyltransferase [Ignavibacteria bacterium]HQY52784.1 class I SAM-dependent methyltransferase [Ignavibacteria bacterium]HRB00761.1 class I SAM-dependent methyltransferase [Ignavibacteria bacterium]